MLPNFVAEDSRIKERNVIDRFWCEALGHSLIFLLVVFKN